MFQTLIWNCGLCVMPGTREVLGVVRRDSLIVELLPNVVVRFGDREERIGDGGFLFCVEPVWLRRRTSNNETAHQEHSEKW